MLQRPPKRRPFAFLFKRIFSFSGEVYAMIAAWIPLLPLVALLVLAAGWDLASYTIPNFIQLGLILAFVAFCSRRAFLRRCSEFICLPV